jgi:hypothetical protein
LLLTQHAVDSCPRRRGELGQVLLAKRRGNRAENAAVGEADDDGTQVGHGLQRSGGFAKIAVSPLSRQATPTPNNPRVNATLIVGAASTLPVLDLSADRHEPESEAAR